MTIKASGQFDDDLDFVIEDDSNVYKSCAVTFKNEFYVYGSYYENEEWYRPISKIDGCRLRKIGELPFYHSYGACAVVDDDSIYLCFNDFGGNTYKVCHFATQPQGPFASVPKSHFNHGRIRIAASKSCLFFSRYK